jgi:6-phosphofructokinase 1
MTRVAIVNCGGLCPGLNNVIRGLVLELAENYGVTDIVGYRDGYRGLVNRDEPMRLTPALVAGIHNRGGTILGTSRGGQDTADIVTTLIRHGVSVLLVIGGDGTLRGAEEIADAAAGRGLRLSVVGVPKTIDNDIPTSTTASASRRRSLAPPSRSRRRTPRPAPPRTASAWSS